jgi:hypothetical protein
MFLIILSVEDGYVVYWTMRKAAVFNSSMNASIILPLVDALSFPHRAPII